MFPKLSAIAILLICFQTSLAQNKKPLTHDVYDKWEGLGERSINKPGTHVFYAINPQEGDGTLYISDVKNTKSKQIERGYGASFTNDGQFVIGKIKPFFKDTRDAKIKKKKPDEMPKDTLFIYNIALDSLWKTAKVKSFKTPKKADGWLAYLLEKSDKPDGPKPTAPAKPDSLTQIRQVLNMADSLRRVADSLVLKTKEAKTNGLAVLAPAKKTAQAKPVPPAKEEDPITEGTDLVLRNLTTGKEQTFKLANEYFFDEMGNTLLVESSKKKGDSTKKAAVVRYRLKENATDTVFAGFNDAKNYAMDEAGNQIAFVIEKDSAAKTLQKFYKLMYYKQGATTADIKIDRASEKMPKGFTVSPDYNNNFSKDGNQLYFGITPIRKPKDTTLVDFETARLDVWHYNDDYLQPQQLVQLQRELSRSHMMVMQSSNNNIVRLGGDTTERVSIVDEGNAPYVFASSDKGKRVAGQWLGYTPQNGYVISTQTGAITNVFRNARAFASTSPKGRFVLWYDWDKKAWFTFNVASQKTANISKGIKTPVFDEDDDHPDAPPPHGIMNWTANDADVYLYDKYDIFKCDPNGIVAPIRITNGREKRIITRWVAVDEEDRFLPANKTQLFTTFSELTKKRSVIVTKNYDNLNIEEPTTPSMMRGFTRAENNEAAFIYAAETPQTAAKLVHFSQSQNGVVNSNDVVAFSQPNPQQADYNWYTTELVRWKMFDGKMSEGILYKPENFDPNKKYPVIFYFYERDADDLYNYRAAAPSASTVNIPYFTSNGYLVFDPNIYYKNGEPGESAYNSVVSAAKHLGKTYKFVDSTKMAIQGQSWGGYQVAYLITRTNIFAAAGAGAPVANMTSAYGGIRWGSGLNRQFQYEHSQTRIGANLWQRRDLYIKNSPLFFVDKVKTPLLMMHNDKDGAVPWYQGIEYFTALRRLDKKVWMLQYNDEDHNLVERRNRKDLSVRLGQFFDHYLKGKPMPVWMEKGVPATEKGIEWGLE